MKISEFAKLFNLSVDTVRFYVDNGLILPEKKYNRHVYDDKCKKDLRFILDLKNMKFSITEIGKIMNYIRLIGSSDKDSKEYLRNIFNSQFTQLLEERKEIDSSLKLLKEKIDNLENPEIEKISNIGIPFEFFQYFYCPECNKQFKLNKAYIEDNEIFRGELDCLCGKRYIIKDGIVINENLEKNYNKINYTNKKNLAEFIQNFVEKENNLYISTIAKNEEWHLKRIDYERFHNKFVLHLRPNYGFVFNKLKDKIDNSNYHILLDNDLEAIHGYKDYLESIGVNKKMIFILDNPLNPPLKENLIDVFFDFFASLNYIVLKQDNLVLNNFKKCLKDNSTLYFLSFFPEDLYYVKDEMKKYKNFIKFMKLDNLKIALKDYIKIEEYIHKSPKMNTEELSMLFKPDVQLNLYNFIGTLKK